MQLVCFCTRSVRQRFFTPFNTISIYFNALISLYLTGDLILHMFEEQAFLLRDELHLYGVLAQQVGQGQRYEKRVLLSWLYSQALQLLWVS